MNAWKAMAEKMSTTVMNQAPQVGRNPRGNYQPGQGDCLSGAEQANDCPGRKENQEHESSPKKSLSQTDTLIQIINDNDNLGAIPALLHSKATELKTTQPWYDIRLVWGHLKSNIAKKGKDPKNQLQMRMFNAPRHRQQYHPVPHRDCAVGAVP
ncbi:hypothetical protein THH46_18810 [Pseudomonas sp. NA13]